jgi:hypothetical protein
MDGGIILFFFEISKFRHFRKGRRDPPGPLCWQEGRRRSQYVFRFK